MKISALILAGGKSSRMNYNNKAYLTFQGSTFIDRIVDEFKKNADEILISMRSYSDETYKDFKVIRDIYENCGPLGGIYTALTLCHSDILYVAACDMPKIKFELYNYLQKYMTDECDAVIPMINGWKQPVAGIYRKSSLKVMQDNLRSEEYMMGKTLDELDTIYVEIGWHKKLCNMLMNINTNKEYEELIKEEKNGTKDA